MHTKLQQPVIPTVIQLEVKDILTEGEKCNNI